MKSQPTKSIAAALKQNRKVTDARFDRLYPKKIREFSKIHWTALDIALRATEFFECDRNTRLLDVGSGCGKFCVLAALKRPGRFTGIEQRPNLVEAATQVARKFRLKKVKFIHGDMADLDWSKFNAFYLFNPFIENEFKSIRIDKQIKMGPTKYKKYVATVKRKLDAAPTGTQVVTYYGFGGRMPAGYKRMRKEKAGRDFLELWVKTK